MLYLIHRYVCVCVCVFLYRLRHHYEDEVKCSTCGYFCVSMFFSDSLWLAVIEQREEKDEMHTREVGEWNSQMKGKGI